MVVHHLGKMLCTHQECLCWMVAILDFSENRTYAVVEFMEIFNCGQILYKQTEFS